MVSCKPEQSSPLPILGNKQLIDGKEVHVTVGNIDHFNQDSVRISNKDLAQNIYVADFFFTSCPSICPKVAKEMLKVYEAFKDEPMVKLVSFTIDPKRDTPQKLGLYASNLGVDTKKWMFLSGEKESTFALARTFFVSALEDKSAPGGFDHSGMIILVDKQGHVRAFSEGKDPSKTSEFISNIKRLLKEYKPENG
jgi:protein SCO1